MKIRSRGTVYKSGDLSLVIVWTSLIFHYFFFFFLLLPLLLFPLLFHPSVRMVLEMDDFCRWSSRRWRGRIFRRYGKREVMQRIGVTGWARQSRVNKFVAFENLFFGRPVLINNNSESKIYKYIRWFSLLSTVKIATATRIPTMEGGGGGGTRVVVLEWTRKAPVSKTKSDEWRVCESTHHRNRIYISVNITRLSLCIPLRERKGKLASVSPHPPLLWISELRKEDRDKFKNETWNRR